MSTTFIKKNLKILKKRFTYHNCNPKTQRDCCNKPSSTDTLWLLFFLSHIQCNLFHSPPFSHSPCSSKTLKGCKPSPSNTATPCICCCSTTPKTHLDMLHRHYLENICTSAHRCWKWKAGRERKSLIGLLQKDTYRTLQILCLTVQNTATKDGQVHVCHLHPSFVQTS